MKKMFGFIICLTALLTVAFFTTSNETTTPDNDVPMVGILQLTSHPALDLIYQGTVDALN